MKNKISREEFEELLTKYHEGSANPSERELIDTWLNDLDNNKEAFDSENSEDVIKSRTWALINKQTQVIEQPYRWKPLAIAASVTFLLLCTYVTHLVFKTNLPPVTTAEFVNNDPDTRQIKLNDGTEVLLYPGSEIKVDIPDESRTRRVELKGKAYFHVTRDEKRPFTVYTGQIKTTVLGTSFIIDGTSSKDRIQISVETGRVSVSEVEDHKGSQKVLLIANQQATFDAIKKELTTSVSEQPMVAENLKTLVEYNERPLREVLTALRTTYGVEIRFNNDSIQNCKITTSFDEEGLFDRLSIIAKAVGGTYHVERGIIYFKNSGCK